MALPRSDGERSNEGLERYRAAFLVAAAYDIVLGIAFFFFYRPIFRALGITPPSHPSHAQLTAAFVFVQGAGYLLVALNPRRNVDLVRLGALYKLVYCGVACYYLLSGRLLSNIFGWFAILDAGFLALFLAFLRRERLLGGTVAGMGDDAEVVREI